MFLKVEINNEINGDRSPKSLKKRLNKKSKIKVDEPEDRVQ